MSSAANEPALLPLVLLRHGESEWTADNLFCGWVDVPLTSKGRSDAHVAGRAIADDLQEADFDVVFTSLLRRATETTDIVLAELKAAKAATKATTRADPRPPDVLQDWRLNERHYGALTGFNKAEMAELYGLEQVAVWRRSYDVRPPPMDKDHPYYNDIVRNPAFRDVAAHCIPTHESLEDLVARTVPFYLERVVPLLRSGRRVLIVAHGTVLRGLVMYLEQMSRDEVTRLNVPTAIPFVYELDRETLRPVGQKVYLADEDRVRKEVAKVASVGRKSRSHPNTTEGLLDLGGSGN